MSRYHSASPLPHGKSLIRCNDTPMRYNGRYRPNLLIEPVGTTFNPQLTRGIRQSLTIVSHLPTTLCCPAFWLLVLVQTLLEVLYHKQTTLSSNCGCFSFELLIFQAKSAPAARRRMRLGGSACKGALDQPDNKGRHKRHERKGQ